VTLGGVARVVVPGVRRIHAQVAPYARLWEEANAAALSGAGPLWVVLGDSTAQGVGAPSYDQGYVGQLRKRLDAERPRPGGPWRILNWSRSGARTAELIEMQLPRLDALLRDVKPDLLTVAIGANDVYKTPIDQLVRELRVVIGRLPAGAVMATIPQGLRPRKAQVANAVIRNEAPAAGLVVADVWARTGPPWRGKFASDQFHPGPLGYADWANAFAEALGLPVR
jgi:lysophospholipase L1-like esterase